MSRSYRRTPILGHGGGSEKHDKRIYNRCLRSRVRQVLHVRNDLDAVVLPEVRDVSNPWSMNKDGKSYCDELAAFVHTMDKVVRVRGGRRREQLVITDATIDLADTTNENRRSRYYSWVSDDSWSARFDLRFDADYYVDGIRK